MANSPQKRKDVKGVIDLDKLHKTNPPLAKVVEAIREGKTHRDSGTADIAQDIALMLAARNSKTSLGKALDHYEESLTVAEASSEIEDEIQRGMRPPRPNLRDD